MPSPISPLLPLHDALPIYVIHPIDLRRPLRHQPRQYQRRRRPKIRSHHRRTLHLLHPLHHRRRSLFPHPSPHPIQFPHMCKPIDRKSTRLNSSHTVISYALSHLSTPSPTRRSSDLCDTSDRSSSSPSPPTPPIPAPPTPEDPKPSPAHPASPSPPAPPPSIPLSAPFPPSDSIPPHV